MRENPEIQVKERHAVGHLRYQGSGRQMGLVLAWIDLPPEKAGHSCQTCWGKGRSIHMRSHTGGCTGARGLETAGHLVAHALSATQETSSPLSQEEKFSRSPGLPGDREMCVVRSVCCQTPGIPAVGLHSRGLARSVYSE